MDVQSISVEAIRNKTVAILGYGNQGRAQALNLRDSGVAVVVGARRGAGYERATEDGFEPVSLEQATTQGDLVGFLLADAAISAIYGNLRGLLKAKIAFFSHGYSWTFGGLEPSPDCRHFLIGPKGAGAILRKEYESGSGLPGVYAIDDPGKEELRPLVLAYGKATGIGVGTMFETSFREETICDLFGEQAVLCGGIPRLLEAAYQTLRRHGMSPEMAFFECCYEARMILDLWLTHGPRELADRISPVAFFGGTTRGNRVFGADLDARLEEIYQDIDSGKFAREYAGDRTKVVLQEERQRLAALELEQTYQGLKGSWGST